jgi:hypothetical protein
MFLQFLFYQRLIHIPFKPTTLSSDKALEFHYTFKQPGA